MALDLFTELPGLRRTSRGEREVFAEYEREMEIEIQIMIRRARRIVWPIIDREAKAEPSGYCPPTSQFICTSITIG